MTVCGQRAEITTLAAFRGSAQSRSRQLSRRRCWLIVLVGMAWGVLMDDVVVFGARSPRNGSEVRALVFGAVCSATTWPEEALRGERDPFVITFMGGNPLDQDGLDYLRELKVLGRRISIRQLSEGEDPGGCHVLYIHSTTGRSVVEEAIQAVQGRKVLTIGRHPDFQSLGGMVRWVERGTRIGSKTLYCEFNLDAFQADDLSPPRKENVEKLQNTGVPLPS